MKKLLIFYLVLSMTKLTLADPYFGIIEDIYEPGDIYTLWLVGSDDPDKYVERFDIDAITDNGAGGIALGPQEFHSNFSWVETHPGTLNYDGKLCVDVWGNLSPNGYLPRGGASFYHFDYEVPYSPHDITISTYADGVNYRLPRFWYSDDSFYEGHVYTIVHVPEPATIALLGLGALLLRRHK